MSGEARGPLAGIRVMDVSIMAAGPWTGALLGMLGAEVVKVEPPAGDGTRWVMPTQRGMGTNFIAMNVNKEDIELDLKAARDRELALELVASCDVFLQNFRVGVIEKLGFDFAALAQVNPRLIYCAISGFGEVGPLAKAGCADPIMQAFSGFARSNGAPGDAVEAFRFTGFIDLTTASVATQGILAALLDRERTGLGQKVEVSMLEAALEIQATRIAELLGAGLVPRPRGSESPAFAPDRAYRSKDHDVFLCARSQTEWRGFCAALEQPQLAEDARFVDNRARVANRDALDALVAPLIDARPAIWWVRIMRRHGVPAGLAHHFETFRHHEQVIANEMIARLRTDAWGDICVGGLPWLFERTPCAVVPAARPGEHTDEVLGALAARAMRKSAPAARENGPFAIEGAQVVELAEGIAGPLAAQRLAELGAQVVKVEPIDGDWMRHAAPSLAGASESAAFLEMNRGKRSVRLSQDATRDAVMLSRLLERADVLITDRTPRELAALGIALQDDDGNVRYPKLVAVRVSAWGTRGPWSEHPGSELTAQAMAGYTRYLGVHGEPACRLGADVASTGTATFAVQAVLAALYWRLGSGRGQCVDVSLLSSLLAMKSIHLAAQSDPDGFVGPRVGGANNPPERGWKTADDPIFFSFGGSVGAEGRPGWEKFVQEIGLEHLLTDPRCDRTGRRTTGFGAHVHSIRPEYERAFARYPAEELAQWIRRHTGSCSVYLRADQTIAHPQTAALDIVREIAVRPGVPARVRAYPVRFSRLRPAVPGGLLALGAHTDEIRRELGLTG